MLKFCVVKGQICLMFTKWLPIITIYSDGHIGMPLMTLNGTHSSAKEANVFCIKWIFKVTI